LRCEVLRLWITVVRIYPFLTQGGASSITQCVTVLQCRRHPEDVDHDNTGGHS
jgi:hypothetical protein